MHKHFAASLFYVVLVAGQTMYVEKEYVVLIAGSDFI